MIGFCLGYGFLLFAVALAAYERGAYKGSREAERLMMPALEKIVAEIVRLRGE